MTTDMAHKIEMARMLFNFAQTVRCGKKRNPGLAAVASEREAVFKRELEELEAEAARETTEGGEQHRQAA